MSVTPVRERVARLLESSAGEQVLRSLEDEAAAKEAVVERRRKAVDELRTVERSRAESLPGLRAAMEKVRGELHAARAALKEVERRMQTAGLRYATERDRLDSAADRATVELRRTRDPRLVEAERRIAAALDDRNSLAALVRQETRTTKTGAFGMGRKIVERGSNLRAVTAIGDRMKEALEEVRALALEAVPPADLEARLVALVATADLPEPPPMVWTRVEPAGRPAAEASVR